MPQAFVKILSLATLRQALFLLLAFRSAAIAQFPQADRVAPLFDGRIAKGLAVEEKLWLRGSLGKNPAGDGSGGLASISLKDQSSHVYFEKGVLDIAKSGSDLWILRRLAQQGREFVVSVWKADHFDDLGQFTSSEKDVPMALFIDQGSPGVLSQQTIRQLSPDHTWRSMNLKGILRRGVQESIAAPDTGGSLFVGVNRGEWGGGLQRVDLQTGAVSSVERRDGKGLCDGPLNSDCDPVTGLIPDPESKQCILAAVGLVHMFTSTGRILKICEGMVTLFAEKPLPNQAISKRKMTEAFYGLATDSSRGFWAITQNALYHYPGGGESDAEYKLPALQSVSGVYLSHALPGAVVVRTDLNWSVSTSGYTPLIVPLGTIP